jgi:hypothetical protein
MPYKENNSGNFPHFLWSETYFQKNVFWFIEFIISSASEDEDVINQKKITTSK